MNKYAYLLSLLLGIVAFDVGAVTGDTGAKCKELNFDQFKEAIREQMKENVPSYETAFTAMFDVQRERRLKEGGWPLMDYYKLCKKGKSVADIIKYALEVERVEGYLKDPDPMTAEQYLEGKYGKKIPKHLAALVKKYRKMKK